jgi:hypothetical protein
VRRRIPRSVLSFQGVAYLMILLCVLLSLCGIAVGYTFRKRTNAWCPHCGVVMEYHCPGWNSDGGQGEPEVESRAVHAANLDRRRV